MDRQIEIIDLLLKATIRIGEAIKHNDMDMVKATVSQREVLLKEYNALDVVPLSPNLQEIADRIIIIDQENEALLEKMVSKERSKIEKINREKNDAKKRTAVAKKYVSVGTSIGEYSKFNKKT